MAKILVINGPNLNLLGSRQKEIYGNQTLENICEELNEIAHRQGLTLEFFQSNAEHELINSVQNAPQDDVDFIIINPGALTHTSIALRDAFLAVEIPFIEIHLSNIMAREKFRRHSYLSDVAAGVIFGFGALGYQLALQAAQEYLVKN